MKRVDFSFQTREQAWRSFEAESFDLLVVGGGITGVGIAWDAASRGLKVALVERGDFASGTSSKSSKLVHGGLRYLENFEFHLVFEALRERTFLLKELPDRVTPLPFYWPIFEGDPHGWLKMKLGLTLYDLLALFHAPMRHRSLKKSALLQALPGLKEQGLKAGFRYYDAMMWDDLLTVDVARAAHAWGAKVANYVEAVRPTLNAEGKCDGFEVLDRMQNRKTNIRAEKVILAVGPWTDLMGEKVDGEAWRKRLKPSQGTHLVFPYELLPVQGAMVMNEPETGRIAFVMPRKDFGTGVTIVGTTDAPVKGALGHLSPHIEEVDSILELLNRYFPVRQWSARDAVSAYVGVRPLVGSSETAIQVRDEAAAALSLQKVSREHEIWSGPHGEFWIAGGKYTTFREMAREAVELCFQDRKSNLGKRRTDHWIGDHLQRTRSEVLRLDFFEKRFGQAAERVRELDRDTASDERVELEGFPFLAGQLRFSLESEMVLTLEDFIMRRTKIFLAHANHGRAAFEPLSRVWARFFGKTEEERVAELDCLEERVHELDLWRNNEL